MSEEEETTRKIGDEKTSKIIVYTADGTEFHLKELIGAEGVMEEGDKIRFHPENIIAIRTKKSLT